MPNPLPLIIAGGAALLLLGGGKKKKGSSKSGGFSSPSLIDPESCTLPMYIHIKTEKSAKIMMQKLMQMMEICDDEVLHTNAGKTPGLLFNYESVTATDTRNLLEFCKKNNTMLWMMDSSRAPDPAPPQLSYGPKGLIPGLEVAMWDLPIDEFLAALPDEKAAIAIINRYSDFVIVPDDGSGTPVDEYIEPVVTSSSWLERQRALALIAKHGLCNSDPGEIDGAVGDNTRGAIRELQMCAGIEVDGKWGSDTSAAVNSYLKAIYES